MFTLIQTIKNPENSSTVKETSTPMDKNAFMLIAYLIIYKPRSQRIIVSKSVKILNIPQLEAGQLLNKYKLKTPALRSNLFTSFTEKETKIVYKVKGLKKDITTMEQLKSLYERLLPLNQQNNPKNSTPLNQTDPACPNANHSQIANNELPPGLDDNQPFNFSPQPLFEDDDLNQVPQWSNQNNLNFFPSNQANLTSFNLGNPPITNSDDLTIEQKQEYGALFASFIEWPPEEDITQCPTSSKR